MSNHYFSCYNLYGLRVHWTNTNLIKFDSHLEIGDCIWWKLVSFYEKDQSQKLLPFFAETLRLDNLKPEKKSGLHQLRHRLRLFLRDGQKLQSEFIHNINWLDCYSFNKYFISDTPVTFYGYNLKFIMELYRYLLIDLQISDADEYDWIDWESGYWRFSARCSHSQ